MRHRLFSSSIALAILFAGCRTVKWSKTSDLADPASHIFAVFHENRLNAMDTAVARAIARGKTPGGVLWLERDGVVYKKAYGNCAVVPERESMTLDMIFDAASLTKVIATTPSIMLLAEQGRVDIDLPVVRYVPEFSANGKEAVTVQHLLTHTSGLRPGISSKTPWSGYRKGIELACREVLRTEPGLVFRYSDINFIMLGEIVRRVSGQSLDVFARRNLFAPLEMRDTEFLPSTVKRSQIAPTEKLKDRVLRGEVHDPTSRRMGGIAGHAGLFISAANLARFARMMLNEGELEGVRVFQPETVRAMTSVHTPPGVSSRRGLGWDIDSGYAGPRGVHFPVGSFGHTGWTGTSIWIDPFSRTFLIFLSNRNHPTEEGSVLALRRELGTLAAEAVHDFNFAHVPGALPRKKAVAKPKLSPAQTRAQVLNGIDMLAAQNFAPLNGLHVGLITNHTGHDHKHRSSIDLLQRAPGVTLQALFSPEHGIQGRFDDKVADSVDAKTGLPIQSLYGVTRKPTPSQLRGLDAMVFDIQDVGARFYTYISTMGLAMEAAAENGLKFFVLDRVNPIGGTAVQGPVRKGGGSFIAYHNIPVRHGMTIGELARMFNVERKLNTDLTVIQLGGWRRDMLLDQTSLPWTSPSPNMRNLTQAILYPGIGILETALSVGRGTDTPFEMIGAPYIDGVSLANELSRLELPGVVFVPVRFTPNTSVHKAMECGGVNFMLTDRLAVKPVCTGIAIAKTLYKMYPDEFPVDKVQRLLLHPSTLEAIREGKSWLSIEASWEGELKSFRKRRTHYMIYR